MHNTYVLSRVLLVLGFLCLVQAESSLANSGSGSLASSSDLLTIEELRWCRYELLRLQGAASHANKDAYLEVLGYNKSARKYHERCMNRSYNPAHSKQIAAELNPIAKYGLRQAGIRQVAFRQVHLSARMRHITGENIHILAIPDAAGRRVATLNRWQDVYVLGEQDNNYVRIEWIPGSLPRRLETGWVKADHITYGSGTSARTKHCLKHQGPAVEENEMLRGTWSRKRFMMLEVANKAEQDAYVKLLNTKQTVVSGFIVPASKSKNIYGLPMDTYSVLFITGEAFSRGCDSFAIRGVAGRMNQPLVYDENNLDWSIEITAPLTSPLHVDYDLYATFERL